MASADFKTKMVFNQPSAYSLNESGIKPNAWLRNNSIFLGGIGGYAYIVTLEPTALHETMKPTFNETIFKQILCRKDATSIASAEVMCNHRLNNGKGLETGVNDCAIQSLDRGMLGMQSFYTLGSTHGLIIMM